MCFQEGMNYVQDSWQWLYMANNDKNIIIERNYQLLP